MNNPFRLEQKEPNIWELTLLDTITNNNWFPYFGEIQDFLFKQKVKGTTLIVNLENCFYITPGPFISILLTLKRCRIEFEYKINFYFSNETDSSKMFLKFCKREGFYKSILDISNNESYVKKIFDLLENGYQNTTKNTSQFNYKTVFPFVLCCEEKNKNNDFIENKVEEYLKQIVSYGASIKLDYQTNLKVNLRNIIYELIDNVYCHAYPNSDYIYYGIYIRFRHSNTDTRKIGLLENKFSEINGSSIMPEDIYIFDSIELYFQDIGIGLIESAKNKEIINKNSKRPLRQLFRPVFYNKRENENKTAHGGLQLIKAMLDENNDFLSVFNEHEFISVFAENANYNPSYSISIKDYYKENENFVWGLGYQFVFLRKVDNKNNIDVENKDDIKSVLSLPLNKNKYRIVEKRSKYSNIINKYEIFSENDDVLYCFLDPKNTKKTVVNIIKQLIKDNQNIESLYLCDIPNFELSIFEMAIDNSTKNYLCGENSSLSNILIITDSLNIVKYSFNKDNKAILQNLGKGKKEILKKYLYMCKTYDTSLLLSLIDYYNDKEYITKGIIEWSENIYLNGYINFDMLTSNKYIYKLLLNSLMRVAGLFNYANALSLDILTKLLVEDYNIINNDHLSENKKIYIGSIIVSGTTRKQFVNDDIESIYFFNRSKHKEIYSLFFSPDKVLGSCVENTHYKREGNTHKITTGEDIINEGHAYISINEMYKILHSYYYTPIVSGHIEYESRHFLNSIDLEKMLIDKNSKLSGFIKNLIQYSLAHYNDEDLSPNNYFDNFKNSCAIIYLSHPLTEMVMRETDDMLSEYIVGVSHIGLLRYGNGLEFSNVCSEYILNLIEKFIEKYPQKELKFIIFDTMCNTGNTQIELKEYISYLCNQKKLDVHVQFIFVALLNSQSSKYKDNFYSFFNINVPSIGANTTCGICKAISILKNTIADVLSSEIITEINNKLFLNWDCKDLRFYYNILEVSSFSPIEINDSYQYNKNEITPKLSFQKVIPLYLFLTREIKLRQDLSYFEKFFEDFQNQIPKDAWLYLCSSFLLEYGNLCHDNFLNKLISFILQNIYCTNNNILKEFCLISLLSLQQSLLVEALKYFLNKNNNFVPIELHSEICLVVNFHYIKDILSTQTKYMISSKVKLGNYRLDIYKQFHGQLINVNGERHSTPIERLKSEKLANITLAINSLKLLKNSLKNQTILYDALFHNDQKSVSNFEVLIKNIDELINELNCFNGTINKNITEKVNHIYEESINIHDMLFKVKGLDSKNVHKKRHVLYELEQILERVTTDTEEIYFDRSYNSLLDLPFAVKDIYYIWNKSLSAEIEYILSNVLKHRKNLICIDSKEYAGLLKIEYRFSSFIIRIWNESNESADIINSHLKTRYSIDLLKDLGIKFYYQTNNSNDENYDDRLSEKAVIAIIEIPNIDGSNL